MKETELFEGTHHPVMMLNEGPAEDTVDLPTTIDACARGIVLTIPCQIAMRVVELT